MATCDADPSGAPGTTPRDASTAARDRARHTHHVLGQVLTQDRGRLVAALARQLRNLDMAEEVLSEATESALTHWGRSGVPQRPEAWLLTVAKRKALDHLRRQSRFGAGPAQVAALLQDEAQGAEPQEIPDDRLRLIFACCHPALDRKSSVALTLRTIAGLPTPMIARAFLDQDTTMGQRISRAKAKIAAAGIPFAVPDAAGWAERLADVLDVVLLIFNAGYVPPEGDDPACDLCSEALYLIALIDRLCPGDPEIEGLWAMMLFIHARRAARRNTVALTEQDPAIWDHGAIERAQSILDRALTRGRRGPFQIQAAIQALHIDAGQTGETDWAQIALLYGSLVQFQDTPVIRLNYAVALGESGHERAALALVETLHSALDDYQPYHAALADLRARLKVPGAATAYERAIALSRSQSDTAFLRARLVRLQDRPGGDDAAKKKAERTLGREVQQGGKDTGQGHVS